MFLNKIPDRKRGLNRIWHAFLYSLSGLRYAYKDEIAFRQELLLFGLLTFVAICLPVSTIYKIFLFICNAAILVVELLNSAIEALVDHISPEYNEVAKKAKDMGSSAVLITLICISIVWIYTLISIFQKDFFRFNLFYLIYK